MNIPAFLANWPNSPVPDTEIWAGRCCAHLIFRDEKLDPGEAQLLADDMAMREHWRRMLPEAAVDSLF